MFQLGGGPSAQTDDRRLAELLPKLRGSFVELNETDGLHSRRRGFFLRPAVSGVISLTVSGVIKVRNGVVSL